MDKQVICRNCKFLKIANNTHYCTNPANQIIENDPINGRLVYNKGIKYYNLNAKNDCTLFIAKEQQQEQEKRTSFWKSIF